MEPRCITVRDRSDYGMFFVKEHDPVEQSGRINYSAVWTCYSSYGVYGHFWSCMGEPLALFIQDVSTDYLLSKVATRITSAERTLKSIRYAIRSNRKQGAIDKETAQAGLDACKAIEREYGDESICTMLYENAALSRCKIEWCDLSTQEFHPQAVGFANRIWPLFVAEMKSPRLEPVAAQATA